MNMTVELIRVRCVARDHIETESSQLCEMENRPIAEAVVNAPKTHTQSSGASFTFEFSYRWITMWMHSLRMYFNFGRIAFSACDSTERTEKKIETENKNTTNFIMCINSVVISIWLFCPLFFSQARHWINAFFFYFSQKNRESIKWLRLDADCVSVCFLLWKKSFFSSSASNQWFFFFVLWFSLPSFLLLALSICISNFCLSMAVFVLHEILFLWRCWCSGCRCGCCCCGTWIGHSISGWWSVRPYLPMFLRCQKKATC